MKMVEVFKTNVTTKRNALKIMRLLKKEWKYYTFNMDLEDCDKILRVETMKEEINTKEIMRFLATINCEIAILE